MAEYAGKTVVELGPNVIRALWERGTQTVIDGLDFRGFPEQHSFDLIDLIYPKIKKWGKLDPTDEYLTRGAMIRRWRKMGRSDQSDV